MSDLRAMCSRVARLPRDRNGNVLVEFALIGPTMILLLLGILQIGLHIQNYNAVRNLAADGSRFAVVEYQKGTRSATSAIETWIRSRAVSGAYNLDTDRFEVIVTQPTTSALSGLVEMDIAISYEAPDYLWSTAANALTIQYTRPVFLPAT